MKEEDELRKKIGTENPFTVPKGYFETFSEELMSKLPEKEMETKLTVGTWQRMKPWIYMTAMFCGIMISVRVFIGEPQQGASLVTETETQQLSDEYIETIMDHSMMDDYTLYQYLTDADSDIYN